MKKHIPYLLIILVLALAYMHPFLSTDTVLHRNDLPSQEVYYYKIIKDAIFKYHALPLWQSNFQGGGPFFSNPEIPFLDPIYLFILLFPPLAALNFSLVFFVFLAGLGMYCLVYTLYKNKQAAVLASVIYMFNGWVFHFIGSSTTIKGYAYFPFLFMFIVLAVNNKEKWLGYTLWATTFSALQIASGSPWIFMYSHIFLLFYFAYALLTKQKMYILKIGLVYLLITTGLCATRLLPAIDTIQPTFRGQTFSYEEFRGDDYLRLNDINTFLIKNGNSPGYTATIGFTAAILVLGSLMFLKRRFVLFSWVVIIIAILIGSGSFLASWMYHLPFISSFRHVSRTMFWVVFLAGILTAYSFIKLQEKTIKLSKILFPVILVLLLVEIGFIGYYTPEKERYFYNLEHNQMLEYLSKQDGLFRVESYVPNAPIVRASLVQKGIFYNLQTIVPESAFVHNNDMLFFGVSMQGPLPKMWGFLNVKFISSDIELNSMDLELVQKFDLCNDCDIEWNPWIVGPYLYENKQVLPRAFLVKNALLVVGKQDKVLSLINFLFKTDWFNQSDVIIISKPSLNGIDASSLDKFAGIIFLEENTIPKDLSILSQYKGKIFPDLFNNKATFQDVLLVESKSMKERNIALYSPNKIRLQLENETGFLVLGEKFAMYPGWTAKLNGKKLELLTADFIGTSLYLENASGILEFNYFPQKLKIGIIVNIITFLVIILMLYFNSKKKVQNE